MNTLGNIKFRVACMMPHWLRKLIYAYKAKNRRKKSCALETQIKDIRNILIHNFQVTSVPPATGKLRLLQEGNSCFLKLFARKCDEHGLRYWLDYGTLLGAIRHKGFIPWDDDLDVSMMRSDYDRLLELLPVLFPREQGFHWIQHAFLQIGYEDTPMNLDVYPYHFAADTYNSQVADKIDCALTLAKKRIILIGGKLNYSDKQIQEMIKKDVLGGAACLAEKYAPAIFLSPAVAFTKNSVFPYDAIFPLKKAIFEGVEMSIPNHARQHLAFYFGDYMSYPPYVGYQHPTVEKMVQKEPFEEDVNRFIDTYGV